MTTEATEALAVQQYAEGLTAFRRGDNEACRRLSAAAIATAEQAGSARGQALGHIGLSRANFRDADYAAGTAHAILAEQHAQACGAPDIATTALHMRAELARAQGKYEETLPMYRLLLAADEASGDQGSLAMEHSNLGSVLVQTGDLDAARSHLRVALDLCPLKPGLLPYVLLGFVGVLARSGQSFDAARILGAVEAHLEAAGEVLDPGEEIELAGHLRAIQAGSDDATHARRSGRQLTLEQAQALLG